MASSKPKVQLSLLEKLDIIPALLSIIGATIYAAITGPIRGEAGGYTYRDHVIHRAIQKMLDRLSPLQSQYVMPDFSIVYDQFCKEKELKSDAVNLPSGCKALWMGNRTAKYVVVYYHGGGFALDGGREHLDYYHKVQQRVNANDDLISFLFIQYTLTPHETYPYQVREAVEAVQYVLKDLGRSASSVLLGGDSAGANLSLAVLSHAMHPAPTVPELKLDKPFKALILVAPWLSFRTDFDSATRNGNKDIVVASSGNKWSGAYMAGHKQTYYSEALEAPADWWKNAAVEQIITVAGSDEILIDPISAWVEKFKVHNANKITYVIGKHEVHNAPILEPMLGNSTPTEQGEAIVSFLKARL